MVYLSNYVVVILYYVSIWSAGNVNVSKLTTGITCGLLRNVIVGGKFIFKELILPKMAEQIERPIPTEER